MGNLLNGYTLYGGVGVTASAGNSFLGIGTKLQLKLPYVTFGVTGGADSDGGNTITGKSTPGSGTTVLEFNGTDIPVGASFGTISGGMGNLTGVAAGLGLGANLRINQALSYLVDGINSRVSGMKFSAGTLTYKIGSSSADISLKHTHKPTFNISGSTVSLTLGDADFNKTTSDEASFDMKDTTWFKGLSLKSTAGSTSCTIALDDNGTSFTGTKTKTLTLTLTGGALSWSNGTVTRADITARIYDGSIILAERKINSTTSTFTLTINNGTVGQKYDGYDRTNNNGSTTIKIKTSAIPTTPST